MEPETMRALAALTLTMCLMMAGCFAPSGEPAHSVRTDDHEGFAETSAEVVAGDSAESHIRWTFNSELDAGYVVVRYVNASAVNLTLDTVWDTSRSNPLYIMLIEPNGSIKDVWFELDFDRSHHAQGDDAVYAGWGDTTLRWKDPAPSPSHRNHIHVLTRTPSSDGHLFVMWAHRTAGFQIIVDFMNAQDVGVVDEGRAVAFGMADFDGGLRAGTPAARLAIQDRMTIFEGASQRFLAYVVAFKPTQGRGSLALEAQDVSRVLDLSGAGTPNCICFDLSIYRFSGQGGLVAQLDYIAERLPKVFVGGAQVNGDWLPAIDDERHHEHER